MRYDVDPDTGKILHIDDPNLYGDKAAEYGFCLPGTVFTDPTDRDFIVSYTQRNRGAYHDFQRKASELLGRGTLPVNGDTAFYTFDLEGGYGNPVAIGRIGLGEDGEQLQAQLFDGDEGTPASATQCTVGEFHTEDGAFAAQNRVLGNVVYRGEEPTAYTLVQLGGEPSYLRYVDMEPPVINGFCEPGTVVAVRADVPVTA